MPLWNLRTERRRRTLNRRLRELRLLANGALDTDHPIMAHIIPIRRCNLSCAYCNEYDDHSKPVPLETILHRLELLGRLRTGVITLSGGEPLLHPELDEIICGIRRNHALAGLITNGYLLTAERVRRLNDAGLDYLQISIDNVMPDDVSKKSLKVLDKKLEILAELATFHVNINSVLGGGIRNPEDALVVGKRAMELGFTSTVGIIHDGDGQLRPLAKGEREVFLEMKKFEKKHFSRINYFQEKIANGEPSDWRCRAGSRYLYICENGLVHYCSQQRGFPAKPLEDYTIQDIRREYVTQKSCAPFCTISCVHQISYFDFFRGEQTLTVEPVPEERLVSIQAAGR
ncbi:MAG: radical SAM protein [Acidobacteriaceae bacterium]|nr:radical SAM protein [Acidobacteriaceae bacterium]MBV9781240.1 radical SAM protein [Acidobacteriaceae bacterium]